MFTLLLACLIPGFSIVRNGKHIPTGEDVAVKVIDRSKYVPNDGSLEREIVVLDKVTCISTWLHEFYKNPNSLEKTRTA